MLPEQDRRVSTFSLRRQANGTNLLMRMETERVHIVDSNVNPPTAGGYGSGGEEGNAGALMFCNAYVNRHAVGEAAGGRSG